MLKIDTFKFKDLIEKCKNKFRDIRQILEMFVEVSQDLFQQINFKNVDSKISELEAIRNYVNNNLKETI